LLLYCFGALPPCYAGLPLNAAASNAVVSYRSHSFQNASSDSALVDVSIYIDQDWIIFGTQAKQRPMRGAETFDEPPTVRLSVKLFI
jgi:hypothetical protein